jgi:tetratricopeptide (TPR) repeat protein
MSRAIIRGMAKPNNPAHRKQVLKQRRAEEQREWNRGDARELYQDARSLLSNGDAPGADRVLRKAALLDPDWADPLVLLANIHVNAGHHAEALAYLRRARKLHDDPMTLYNIGVLHYQIGQTDGAIEAMLPKT